MKKKIRKKNNFGINFIGPIGQPYLVISYFNPANPSYVAVEYLGNNIFRYYSNVRNNMQLFNVQYPQAFGPLDASGNLTIQIEFIPVNNVPIDILQKITWDLN